MQDLSAAATLDLWETGDGLGPVERSLALAAAAGLEPAAAEELARLPLGRRDALLLKLHSALAGRSLEATAPCPACGEQAEFEVDAEALVAQLREPAPASPLDVAGFVVEWRPPDSLDVAAAAETGDAAAAERLLLSRCVVSARRDGEPVTAQLPAPVREALARAIGEADPLAEVLVTVLCPACETAFVADLDVGGFVWAELRAHARQLLHEVDVLARAYGWTEAEVLGLGDRRRAAYLELAGGVEA